MRASLVLPLCVLLAISACEDDPNSPKQSGDSIDTQFTFDEDLGTWLEGTAGGEYDSVRWMDREGGIVKLDGSDLGTSDGQANSWIHQEITLPDNASTLRFDTSAHDRDGADSALRVRLIDDSDQDHILMDWEVQAGVEGDLTWASKSVDISAFAGQTVEIFFEQGDNDVGIHEQRYLDNIQIRTD